MPAITFKPRVKETSTTTGTGNITLAGAVVGYQSFDDAFVVTDDYFHYCIEAVDADGIPTGQWEEGIGHLSASTTMVRDTLLNSSTGSAVSFSAGTKNVFCTVAASHFRQSVVLESAVAKTNDTLVDTALSVNLISGRWYRITVQLVTDGGYDGGGAKVLTSGTATVTGSGVQTCLGVDAGSVAMLSQSFIDHSDSNDIRVVFDGTLECTASGTWLVQFAQNATNASATTLLKYSTITAVDVTPG